MINIYISQDRTSNIKQKVLDAELKQTLQVLKDNDYVKDNDIRIINDSAWYEGLGRFTCFDPKIFDRMLVKDLGNELILLASSDLIIFAPSSYVSKSAAILRVVTAMYNLNYICIDKNYNLVDGANAPIKMPNL